MTDPSRIAERGAERFAPRSHRGPSTPDLHRVARAASCFMASHRTEQSAVVLDRKPPDAGLELECRATIANLRSDERSPPRSRSTVEQRSQLGEGLRVSVRLGGALLLNLGAQRCRAAPNTIPSLTSAGGDRDFAHVRVEVSSILACASVASHQLPCLAREIVACALEGRVQ